MEFRIRKAQVSDAPLLAQAQREIAQVPGFLVSRPYELTDEKFAIKIADLADAENGYFLVAEKQGEIIGHALFDPLQLEAIRHVVHLTLAVHARWQRKGVGQALLGRLIEWARLAPTVEKAELHVRSGNIAAHTLYLKMGFKEEGRLKRRVKVGPGNYLDDVVMGLWLR